MALITYSTSVTDPTPVTAADTIQVDGNDITVTINDLATWAPNGVQQINVVNGTLAIRNTTGSLTTLKVEFNIEVRNASANLDIQGSWISIGTGDGTASQTLTSPTTEYLPGLWVEDSAGSGTYTKYMNVRAPSGVGDTTLADTGTGDRGNFFEHLDGTSTITFGDGTTGNIPANGANIRIPNIAISGKTIEAVTSSRLSVATGQLCSASYTRVIFYNCFVEPDIVATGDFGPTIVTFTDCAFGTEVSSTDAATIQFENCIFSTAFSTGRLLDFVDVHTFIGNDCVFHVPSFSYQLYFNATLNATLTNSNIISTRTGSSLQIQINVDNAGTININNSVFCGFYTDIDCLEYDIHDITCYATANDALTQTLATRAVFELVGSNSKIYNITFPEGHGFGEDIFTLGDSTRLTSNVDVYDITCNDTTGNKFETIAVDLQNVSNLKMYRIWLAAYTASVNVLIKDVIDSVTTGNKYYNIRSNINTTTHKIAVTNSPEIRWVSSGTGGTPPAPNNSNFQLYAHINDEGSIAYVPVTANDLSFMSFTGDAYFDKGGLKFYPNSGEVILEVPYKILGINTFSTLFTYGSGGIGAKGEPTAVLRMAIDEDDGNGYSAWMTIVDTAAYPLPPAADGFYIKYKLSLSAPSATAWYSWIKHTASSVDSTVMYPIATTSITLENIVIGSQYYIFETADPTNVIANSTATTNTEVISNIDYYGDKNVTIRVRKSSSLPKYKPFETQGTLTLNGLSTYVSQEEDNIVT